MVRKQVAVVCLMLLVLAGCNYSTAPGREVEVSGKVVGPDGQPLTGIRVAFVATGGAAVSNAFPLSADQWLPDLHRVPRGWRFIAPDLRGFGGAAPAFESPGLDAITVDDYAADVLERNVSDLMTRNPVTVRADDKAVDAVRVYSSHDIDDVFEACDRMTVMKNGAVVGTVRTADVTREEVLKMIILGASA